MSARSALEVAFRISYRQSSSLLLNSWSSVAASSLLPYWGHRVSLESGRRLLGSKNTLLCMEHIDPWVFCYWTKSLFRSWEGAQEHKDRTSVLQRSSQDSLSVIALCSLIGSSSGELLDPCNSLLMLLFDVKIFMTIVANLDRTSTSESLSRSRACWERLLTVVTGWFTRRMLSMIERMHFIKHE